VICRHCGAEHSDWIGCDQAKAFAGEFVPYTQGGTSQVIEKIVEVLAPRPILHVKWKQSDVIPVKKDITSKEVQALMRKFSHRMPKV
jgi:hypothetical protein